MAICTRCEYYDIDEEICKKFDTEIGIEEAKKDVGCQDFQEHGE